MFVAGDRVVYSASDLAAAARCEYALLRSFDAQLGRGPAVAVVDELRRQVGVTFTVADLARSYRTASSWYFDLAARVAPSEPDAWDPALALDAGFGRMSRLATDAPGRGRG